MTPLAVGDHVEFANAKVRQTPQGMDLRLRPPANVRVGERGIVREITKTGDPTIPWGAKLSTLPPPTYWSADLWFIEVTFADGRVATLLASWLRKLSLLEIIAEAAR